MKKPSGVITLGFFHYHSYPQAAISIDEHILLPGKPFLAIYGEFAMCKMVMLYNRLGLLETRRGSWSGFPGIGGDAESREK